MLRISVIALTMGLFFSAPAFAGDQVRGVIKKIDLESGHLHIELLGIGNRGQPMVFDLNRNTIVQFSREQGDLVDLTVGKRARIIFDDNQNGKVAVLIRLFGRPPARADRKPLPMPKVETEKKPLVPGNGNKGTVVTGALRRVAYADREVVLIGPGKEGPKTETIVQIPEDIKVIVNGKEIPYTDLKDGQQASIRTVTENGKQIAQLIHVGEGPLPQLEAQKPRQMPSDDRPALRRLLKIAESVLRRVNQALDK